MKFLIRNTSSSFFLKDRLTEACNYWLIICTGLKWLVFIILIYLLVFPGMYNLELVGECLYEWNIQLMSVDPDSPLHNDLVLLNEKEGKNFILLNMLFKETYPFEPPFVRVVYPIISGGYVLVSTVTCYRYQSVAQFFFL